MYEPWRLDDTANILGLEAAALTFNTPSGIVICNDTTCDQPLPLVRRESSASSPLTQGSASRLGPTPASLHGCSRADTVECCQPGAVRQFVLPGLHISLTRNSENEECFPSDPWGGPYVCTMDAPNGNNLNLEGALKRPN